MLEQSVNRIAQAMQVTSQDAKRVRELVDRLMVRTEDLDSSATGPDVSQADRFASLLSRAETVIDCLQRALGERLPTKKPVLLVVDDDPAMVRALILSLRNEFQILATSSGEEALRLLHRFRPGFAVLDFQIGDMDGLDLARQFMRLNPSGRCVVLTGHGTEELKENVRQCGAHFVAKPASTEELRFAVMHGTEVE